MDSRPKRAIEVVAEFRLGQFSLAGSRQR